jgi:periplasmic mercuric ion binding protein
MLRNVFLLAGLVFASAALAEDKTVTLSVPGMYCEMCPATVKKALSRVPGVVKVDASYKDKQAVVTYDDSKTSIDALTGATANAGYPSTPKQ